MKLVIGNKNYSSWSMRPWVLAKGLGIGFEEVMLRFDFSEGSPFYQALAAHTPAGKVPVLIEDDGFAVWDTLAIAEYLAERYPEAGVWPRDARLRARARSLCAEMHSGFGQLRTHCPMNIEADLRAKGAELMAGEAGLRKDLARVCELLENALSASGGPFLFGDFGAADAFYAPVAMRIRTYGLPVPAAVGAYVDRLAAAPGVRDWITQALAEHDFIADDEPYRTAPSQA